ncbi:Meiotic recombination protein rec8 [Escovopsis weberi]|uniref:Meiotic recombination protein rec8 n=1 Tax=Escovopsis weberi TaxID=150374 RepID=A0A0M8MWD7_ESCWE|nr:Meiotic recombination protein rec8 [Escovopsis weberi]
MFYSHEILSNRQYGVATIWLVATVGKENQRRLTKRAIQEVNVPKACEKILDPGAPLALRLQGNLLYGVSRVFSQQCGYVLTAAEKTQSDMVTFFRIMQTSDIDSHAGKTKRRNIVLEDDPSFDLMSSLPNLDQLKWDKDTVLPRSQGSSAADVSQFTPLGSIQSASFPGCKSALINLELPSSSHSAANCRVPSEFGQQSPLFPKTAGGTINMPEFQPFVDDELDPVSGVGLEFDADGNLIGIAQEPELPQLPGDGHQIHQQLAMATVARRQAGDEETGGLVLGEDDACPLDLGEPALPDAPAFPISTRQGSHDPSPTQPVAPEAGEVEQASARNIRKRRVKNMNFLDAEISVPRKQVNEWIGLYVDNMEAVNNRSNKTTLSQAKKNAFVFLYGNGIADIGAFRGAGGYSHPLAVDFSGKSLQQRLMGEEPDAPDTEPPATRRGRRRNSDEAFEADQEIDQDRPIARQRLDGEAELGRGDDHMEEGHIVLDDLSFPEMGMEPAPHLEDRHSSSVMPWSRPGSVVPGSSVRGSAQKQKTAPSSLFGTGNAYHTIDRYSDPAEPPFNLGDFASHGSSSRVDGSLGLLDLDAAVGGHPAAGHLDVASQDFLDFAKEQTVKKGKALREDKQNRRWVEFGELVDPEVHSRNVAAQAFLHVLSLATKNAICVKQEGEKDMVPFGTIRLGLDVSKEMREQAELEDELA